MRRFVCLVVALAAALGGHAIMFTSSLTSIAHFDPDAASHLVPAGAAVVGGALLAAIAVLTAAWSALGAALIGLVEILGSLAAVLVAAAGPDGLTLVRHVARDVDGFHSGLGQGLLFSALSGLLLVEGVLTFVIALTLRARRNAWVEHPIGARITSAIVSLLFFPPVLLALLWAGYQQYRVHIVLHTDRLDSTALIGFVVLFFGPIVLAILALGTRWSGLGAILAGLGATAAGLLAAVPGLVTHIPVRLPTALDLVVGRQIGSGGLAAIGLLLVLGGIGSRIAGVLGDRRETRARADAAEADAPFGIPSFY